MNAHRVLCGCDVCWATADLADDPELWEPGMVKHIPRIEGRSYPCIITRVTPTMIEFRGPTGDAGITRTLYTHLIKEQAA